MDLGQKSAVLHTVARTPVRVTRPARRLPEKKSTDLLAKYQEMVLEDSVVGPAQSNPPHFRPNTLRESDVDPVGDNFTRALRLKLDWYINKAPGLRVTANPLSSPNQSPKARSTISDMRGKTIERPYTKTGQLPKVGRTRYGDWGEHRKGKLSVLDVYKNEANATQTHFRAKSLLSSLGFHPKEVLPESNSPLYSDFKSSLAHEKAPKSLKIASKMLDLTAPTTLHPFIHPTRPYIIPSRYDSGGPSKSSKRAKSNDYEAIECLRRHKGAAMDKMYETLMCEFQLDASSVPDDLRTVSYIGAHNIFNSQL